MIERKLNPAETSSLLVNHVLERVNRRTQTTRGFNNHLDDPVYIRVVFNLWQSILDDSAKSAVLRDIVTTTLDARASQSIPQELLLTDREASILRVRYGFEDGVVRNQKNAAHTLGVSLKTVRRVELRALDKLSDPNGWNQEFMKVRPENFPLY